MKKSTKKSRRQFLKSASALALLPAVPPLRKRAVLSLEESVHKTDVYPLIHSGGYESIQMEGDLLIRAMKNYDRLESEIYHPENDFGENGNEGWPGDKEGRIILGLTLQAQATHREPRYLKEIIDLIPKYVNERGYIGPVLDGMLNEQQLSGHGWLLRGLCEYYLWKKDPKVKKHIQNILTNLALPAKGLYKQYPINPEERKQDVGEASGDTISQVGSWQLSSDTGCAFIFLDGVVQAYSILPSQELKSLIEEMIDRFLQMNIVALKLQTHATLTSLRGLLRYYEVSGSNWILQAVAERYRIYRTVGMTENYENFNWFDRPKWTEPCAIVDSFMIATQLWHFTGNSIYLEDAHHIFYNGLGHTQRANGGFGLDNCPGPEEDTINVIADEAWWCCTMRGGEGLASAIKYSYYQEGHELFLPFYHDSTFQFRLKNKTIKMKQQTDYPLKGTVNLEVLEVNGGANILFKFFIPSWATGPKLAVDGQEMGYRTANGFIYSEIRLKKGTKIHLSFHQELKVYQNVNMAHTRAGHYGVAYGPLVLCAEGKDSKLKTGLKNERLGTHEWEIGGVKMTPLMHVLNPEVSEGSGYERQILFEYV